MANIKISLVNLPSLFTTMRVYRSTDSSVVFDESKFLQEVPAANTYTDTTTTRDPAARAFYYGFRYSTSGGVIQDVGPFTIRNLYDLDYLHGYDLPHPFKLGAANLGMYHTDPTFEFTPSGADVQALIRAKFPSASVTWATDVRRVITLNGKLYLWGAPYVSLSQTYTAIITMLANFRKSNMEQAADSSWTITKNGVKWELTMLLQEELSAAGKFMNGSTVGDTPIPIQSITMPSVSTLAAPISGNDNAFGYPTTGVNSDGSWTMGQRVPSTTTATIYPSFVMKYIGRV